MLLVLRVLVELIRYEIVQAIGGFKRVLASVRNTAVARTFADDEAVRRICDAVALASCFYWKPVLCLPRSVVTTRLLRKRGLPAQMVIGYRPSPFFSHAWVEVNGRVVNDSPAYQEKLLVLERV
jgi:hypothetical protein